MKETNKTIIFVCTAAAMVLLAVVTYWANRPRIISDFGAVGQPFFESFESNKQAASLEVYALDEKGKRRRFEVRNQNGLWIIPSHNNYPAEAGDRLAETATAVIGLTREALAGRNASEHERFGVLDPNADGTTDPESAGRRLVLKDSNNSILADFIIGNQIELQEADADRPAFEQDRTQQYYYVRRTDENQTYKVRLTLNLSTNFADWINPELLQVEGGNIVKLNLDDYQLKEESRDALGQFVTLVKVPGEPASLSRKNSFDPWVLDGLDLDRFQLESQKVNDLATTLEQLRIVGVRPKFKYNGQQLLSADLKVNRPEGLQPGTREFDDFREALGRLQEELTEKGFNLAPASENSNDVVLVSEYGEVSLGTTEGVGYLLQFGKPVEGDEQSIEIGVTSETTPTSDATPGEKKDSVEKPGAADDNQNNSTDAAQTPSQPPSTSEKVANRYVMIRVNTDLQLLGAKPNPPVEPVKPEPPPGYVPAEAPKPTNPANPQPAEQPQQDRDPAFVDYDKRLADYESAKTQYEIDKTRYEDDLKVYDEKVKKAEQRATELNQRFGDWYYVVSADNLEALRVKRSELFSPKPVPPGPPPLPERPNINFDESPPAETPSDDAAESTNDAAPHPLEPKKDEPKDDSSGGNSSSG